MLQWIIFQITLQVPGHMTTWGSQQSRTSSSSNNDHIDVLLNLDYDATYVHCIASSIYSESTQSCNSFQTMGSRYLGYKRVLYTTIPWHVPVS